MPLPCRRLAVGMLSGALVAASPAVAAPDVVRKPVAGGFPIAASVEVPAGASTIYLSGVGADVADPKAPARTIGAYGDTETQVRSALGKIGDALKGLGLGFGDVVLMHVYLVADPSTRMLDFAGMMKAYRERFGTASQPNLPARSAFQVAGLANPGWLVEIEVTAVRKPQ